MTEKIFRNEAEIYRQLAASRLLDDPQHAPDPSVLDLARVILGVGLAGDTP